MMMRGASLKCRGGERGVTEIVTRYDFEDTYDGLGDELDEKDDDLNDDTFGASEPVGMGSNLTVRLVGGC